MHKNKEFNGDYTWRQGLPALGTCDLRCRKRVEKTERVCTTTSRMIIRYNQLEVAPRGALIALPGFLVPAFFRPQQSRFISTTPRCRSRIGSAPLSLPPDVDLRILEPPPLRNNDIFRADPPRKVEVQGPLGLLKCPHRAISSDAQ